MAVLVHVLRIGKPDLLGVEEWDGPTPDLPHPHRLVRPAGGGNPVVYDTTRYTLVQISARTLVPSQFVGHLVGRKATLPPSVATVATFLDHTTGQRVTLIVCHLTAEVQQGRGYRTDRAHRPRVLRHRAERAALSALITYYRLRKRTVYVVGDTNYDGMTLPPLVACWVGHDSQEHDGTLGDRTVDYIYASTRADHVQVIATKSDHDSVVAKYSR